MPNQRGHSHLAGEKILVTGAAGHIGQELCRALNAAGNELIATDISSEAAGPGDSLASVPITSCDLRKSEEVRRLLAAESVSRVIHLAGVLPSAYLSDPIYGAEVNLCASVELLRTAMENGVQGFVFASSMSVYGSGTSVRPRSEDDPAAPDDPYGASKRAIELIGEQMSRQRGMEFVALRIARVVGPGIKKTSSPWRSQIFERERSETIEVPFAPDAKLSLVHVKEVARMLIVLASTVSPRQQIYNTPADVLEAAQLKNIVETMMHSRVELGLPGCYAGPACDGTRFTTEFGFVPKKLADLLSHPTAGVENDSDPAHPLP